MNGLTTKDVQSSDVLEAIKNPLKIQNLANAPRVDTGCLELVHDVGQAGFTYTRPVMYVQNGIDISAGPTQLRIFDTTQVQRLVVLQLYSSDATGVVDLNAYIEDSRDSLNVQFVREANVTTNESFIYVYEPGIIFGEHLRLMFNFTGGGAGDTINLNVYWLQAEVDCELAK